MKKNKSFEFIRKGSDIFTRIFMKYEIMERKPVDIGGDRIHASHIHMIEALGKKWGNTVTALSGYFMVTKGAVSQIVSKLCENGYIVKTKKEGNNKEIILELTERGRNAFEFHEKNNISAMSDLFQIGNEYNEREIQSFLNILNDIDQIFGRLIAEKNKK